MARITKATKVKVALILLLCFVLCFGLVSCSSGCSAALRHATGLAGGTYAGVTYSEEGNFSIPKDDVREIDITWLAGSVDISVEDDATAKNEVIGTEEFSGGAREDFKMTWQMDDGILRIGYGKVVWGLFGCANYGDKRLSLKLPTSLAKSLETVSVDGASGDYNFSGITCKTLDVTMASGQVHGVNLSADNVDLDIASGTVSLSGEFANSVDADLASGDVGVECFNKCPASMDFDLMSGRIDLGLPKGSGFKVDLDKVSGNFDCAFPGQWGWSDQDDAPNGSPDIYMAGDGANSLKVNMTSGNVNVYKLEGSGTLGDADGDHHA